MIQTTNSETLASPRMKPVEGEEVNKRSKVFERIQVSEEIKV
jgi:hypothetical protein